MQAKCLMSAPFFLFLPFRYNPAVHVQATRNTTKSIADVLRSRSPSIVTPAIVVYRRLFPAPHQESSCRPHQARAV